MDLALLIILSFFRRLLTAFNTDLSDKNYQEFLLKPASSLFQNQNFQSAVAQRLIFRCLSFTSQQIVKLDISLKYQILPKLQIICLPNPMKTHLSLSKSTHSLSKYLLSLYYIKAMK